MTSFSNSTKLIVKFLSISTMNNVIVESAMQAGCCLSCVSRFCGGSATTPTNHSKGGKQLLAEIERAAVLMDLTPMEAESLKRKFLFEVSLEEIFKTHPPEPQSKQQQKQSTKRQQKESDPAYRPKKFDSPATTVAADVVSEIAAPLSVEATAEEVKVTAVSVAPVVDENADNICPTCLGLLQINFEKLTQKAYAEYLSHSYSLPPPHTFNLSIRLPFQLPIRHQAMIYTLKEAVDPKLQDMLIQPSSMAEVKEIFKGNLKEAYAEVSSSSYSVTSPLSLNLHMDHLESRQDYEFLTKLENAELQVKKFKKRGKTLFEGASMEKVARAVKHTTSADFKAAGHLPPLAIHTYPSMEQFSWWHTSVYIAGRYCKLQRHISNSKWVIGGKRITPDSMEELIGGFLPSVFRNGTYKFSSAGREDSDVLMLGSGRPFYFEVIDPKVTDVTPEMMGELERQINEGVDGKIKVYDLQLLSCKEDTNPLKESASTKSKSYSCIIELEKAVTVASVEKLSGSRDLAVDQRNPLRVPRRADMLRNKVIEKMTLTPLNAVDGMVSRICVDLQTSAGTYVKEFMHGDEGRTVPCISTMLDCGIVKVESLDVLHIHLDWPPVKTSGEAAHKF